jgi:hypothetical protein
VYKAAADALQHTLGDLELVFADDKKRQLLVDLPQAALLQLLRDERTRVASENTAAHAVLEWFDGNIATTKQKRQLVRGALSGIWRDKQDKPPRLHCAVLPELLCGVKQALQLLPSAMLRLKCACLRQ